MSKFAVLGPGAVGGFLAGAMHYRSVPVVAISRDRVASRLRTHGLHIKSETAGDFLTRPSAVEELTTAVDVLFITTKAYQMEEALQRVKAPVRLFIPLLSGIEHVSYLRARYPESMTCAASIRIDVQEPEPGEIVHSSKFAVIDTAFDDGWLNHRELRPLVEQLAGAGIAMLVSPSEIQVLWSKIVFLNALSLASAITNMPVGWIRKDPEWRATMEAALEEGAAVAKAEGAKVSVEMTMDYVDHAPYGLGSVMQRDLQAGNQPELDAITGAVLRAAARNRLNCPTIRQLAGQVAQRSGAPSP